MWDIAVFCPPGSDWSDEPIAWSEQIAFYERREAARTGTLDRHSFDSHPLESDCLVELRQHMQALLRADHPVRAASSARLTQKEGEWNHRVPGGPRNRRPTPHPTDRR